VLDNWHAMARQRPEAAGKTCGFERKKGQKIFKNRAKNA